MKLEIKHLSPYLPYQLNCIVDGKIEKLVGIKLHELYYHRSYGNTFGQIELCKPILRPLDLTKEIEVNGDKFVPQNEFFILYGSDVPKIGKNLWKEIFIDNIKYSSIDSISYGVVEKLFEWHFDVFGLIPAGLAIDINTLNLNKWN